MNYSLNKETGKKKTSLSSSRRLIPLMKTEGKKIAIACITILLSAGTTLLAPVLISQAIDTAIRVKDWNTLVFYAIVLFGIYLISVVSEYILMLTMGGLGRRVLFRLRNQLFNKLQSLPIAFFHQNKTGDLISRINNDTDRLNQFFAQILVQFIRSIFLILGAGLFLVFLNIRLGIAVLLPALGVLLITRMISPWIKNKNKESLESLGDMSAEIQESLDNFKVIVAFNRLDYFRTKFNNVNQQNFNASIKSGYANNILKPIYGLATNLAQLIVLVYALALISAGQLTIGLLVGFLLYVNYFYSPLQQIATVWSSFQQALAALDRISEILDMESNIITIPSETTSSKAIIDFQQVSFGYTDTSHVLKDISFTLESGKTYAFVGPTGGGKTTTASLMARLYDPTSGVILFHGKDIRSYTPQERSEKIGFILQEPFLFTGTVLDNIFYGNTEHESLSNKKRIELLKQFGLFDLLSSFSQGLEASVDAKGESISLGQRQLIAFVRAVLRKPDLLILDEATANIDTVTEQLLEEALQKLPTHTTKVVIAHRLNTIKNADGIFFINSGTITPAGSFEHAIEMLMDGGKKS